MSYLKIFLNTILCVTVLNESAKATINNLFNDVMNSIVSGISNRSNQMAQNYLQYQNQGTTPDPQKIANFFTNNDYFILEDLYLREYKNNSLYAVEPHVQFKEKPVDGNVYLINNKYYVYSSKNTFAPAIGYFKEVNLKSEKTYLNGKEDVKSANKKLIPATEENKSDQVRIKEGKTITNDLKVLLKVASISGILDLSKININTITEDEWKNIVAAITKNKHKIKLIVVYFDKNNMDDVKKYISLKRFCSKDAIHLSTIFRKTALDKINESFNNLEVDEIDFSGIELGRFSVAETYVICANALKFIMKRKIQGHNSIINIKFKTRKLDNACKTNLKIIIPFAKKYKKYIRVGIATKKGIKTIGN